REHACAACGVRLQRSDAIPMVLIGGGRGGVEWVRRAISASQLSPDPPHLESRGVFRRVGPWDACEVLVRAGARRVGLLALAAGASADWHDWLLGVAGHVQTGVVCLVGPLGAGGGTRRERRPSLATESAIIDRSVGRALRGADGWEVLRPIGRDEPYEMVSDWLRRSELL
ncbi:MAG: hypothetical protein WCF04_09725, partial [Candidatus Nanopelagicales bacterium]